MLQMLAFVKSVTAALKRIPNESVWLLLAGALQLRGVQVSQDADTIMIQVKIYFEAEENTENKLIQLAIH